MKIKTRNMALFIIAALLVLFGGDGVPIAIVLAIVVAFLAFASLRSIKRCLFE